MHRRSIEKREREEESAEHARRAFLTRGEESSSITAKLAGFVSPI